MDRLKSGYGQLFSVLPQGQYAEDLPAVLTALDRNNEESKRFLRELVQQGTLPDHPKLVKWLSRLYDPSSSGHSDRNFVDRALQYLTLAQLRQLRSAIGG